MQSEHKKVSPGVLNDLDQSVRTRPTIRSSVQLRHWEASRLRRLTTVAACSIATSVIIWNSRLEPSKGRHLPTHNLRSRKGFVFLLYYSYRQLPNATDDLEGEMWREGGTANGRGILEGSHPFLFNVTGRRLNEIDMRAFYIEMKLGKSRKTFRFDIDTGSRQSWVHSKLPLMSQIFLIWDPAKYLRLNLILSFCAKEPIPVYDQYCKLEETYVDGTAVSGVFVQSPNSAVAGQNRDGCFWRDWLCREDEG